MDKKSKDFLDTLHTLIPRGSIKKVAAKKGKTPKAVLDVLKGYYWNEDIVNELLNELEIKTLLCQRLLERSRLN